MRKSYMRMECRSRMVQNNAKTHAPRVEAAVDSQKTCSFDWTLEAHSPQQRKQQTHVSEANIPARLPAVSSPEQTLQACLNEAVSGVSVTRKELFDAVSHVYASIDKMNSDQVLRNLFAHNLDPRGEMKVLKQRLKSYYGHLRISQCHRMLPHSKRMQFDYLVIIDFEATCDKFDKDFVQEIIEFPAVLVDVKERTVRSYFRTFCKPKVNRVLTDFCTHLTGITQTQVDCAKDFSEALINFEHWLHMQKLGTDYKFTVVTDGPYDMAKFFKYQLELAGIHLPEWARQWVNIRKVYRAFYESGRVNLQQMLSKSGIEFQGKPHCGIDDAMNIAAIVLQLLHDGCIFTFNEYFR